jgi:hypothetical protein
MRHSQQVSDSAENATARAASDPLLAGLKLYVDEVFDRTIVALDTLLEPIGIDPATVKWAPGFVAEMAAVVQVAAWEVAGLRQLIQLDFPPAATAMSDLVRRYSVDPMAFMDPAAGTAMFNRVCVAWAVHCHPDARELLGCDVVIVSPPGPAEQAALVAPVIMAIAGKTDPKEVSDEQ